MVAHDERGVTFRWKDYRDKGKTRHKTMTLSAEEFMRRFLLYVLPGSFHRIRHFGLLANANRRECIARSRELLRHAMPVTEAGANAGVNAEPAKPTFVCTHCGAASSSLRPSCADSPSEHRLNRWSRHESKRLSTVTAGVDTGSVRVEGARLRHTLQRPHLRPHKAVRTSAIWPCGHGTHGHRDHVGRLGL